MICIKYKCIINHTFTNIVEIVGGNIRSNKQTSNWQPLLASYFCTPNTDNKPVKRKYPFYFLHPYSE